MTRSVSVNIDLGVVSLIVAFFGWLVSSSTVVWVSWWLCFGFQMLIVGVVLAQMLFGMVSFRFKAQRSLPSIPLSTIALNIVLALVWWKTYIPLIWAVTPFIVGILFKMLFKRSVLPSF